MKSKRLHYVHRVYTDWNNIENLLKRKFSRAFKDKRHWSLNGKIGHIVCLSWSKNYFKSIM
jgi:hypothetical protein